jgi:hypothetical protein
MKEVCADGDQALDQAVSSMNGGALCHVCNTGLAASFARGQELDQRMVQTCQLDNQSSLGMSGIIVC